MKIENSIYQKLVGIWKTRGEVEKEGKSLILDGTDTYEIVFDGHFILHKADVLMGNERNQTLEMISLNPDGRAGMKYFNSKGEKGEMTGEISGDAFHIDGEGIRFRGRFESGTSVINGKWSLRSEDGNWQDFISIKLVKQAEINGQADLQ